MGNYYFNFKTLSFSKVSTCENNTEIAKTNIVQDSDYSVPETEVTFIKKQILKSISKQISEEQQPKKEKQEKKLLKESEQSKENEKTEGKEQDKPKEENPNAKEPEKEKELPKKNPKVEDQENEKEQTKVKDQEKSLKCRPKGLSSRLFLDRSSNTSRPQSIPIEKEQKKEKEQPKVEFLQVGLPKDQEKEKEQPKVELLQVGLPKDQEKEKEQPKVELFQVGLPKDQEKEKEQPTEKVQEKEKEEPKKAEVVTTSQTYEFCGLTNLGLSCYANSCLQVLFNLPSLRHYLLNNPERGPFHKSMYELFEGMQAKATSPKVANQTCVSFRPEQFMAHFRSVKRDFASQRMADAQEFITILLDLLHTETNDVEAKKAKEMVEPKSAEEAWTYHATYIDHSFWSSQLMGQVESTLNCLTCGRKSLSWSCIWQLQLPLVAPKESAPQRVLPQVDSLETWDSYRKSVNPIGFTNPSISSVVTLSECMKAFFAVETLNDDCIPYCEQCAKRCPATKTVTVRRKPKILLVHLTRFFPDGSKNRQPVAIDEHIELSSNTYTLVSAVLHSGTVSYGHYYALLNRPANDQQLWVQLDDETVDEKVSKSTAIDWLRDYAYLCIYQLDEPKDEINCDCFC